MKKRAFFLFVIAFYIFLLLPLDPLLAQEIHPPGKDIIPPQIQHEPPAQEVLAGKSLEIRATIIDNVAVKEVTLFYRIEGASLFSSTNMERVGGGIYSTTIPKDDVAIPGLEYYIRVLDPSGNVAMEGFDFDPLNVAVVPASPDKEEEKAFTETIFPPEEKEVALKSEPSLEKPWYKKWWFWAIAGAVVVGAAAAGGGGGGAGAGGQSGGATVVGPVP